MMFDQERSEALENVLGYEPKREICVLEKQKYVTNVVWLCNDLERLMIEAITLEINICHHIPIGEDKNNGCLAVAVFFYNGDCSRIIIKHYSDFNNDRVAATCAALVDALIEIG